jgi:3-phenylpropionate/trans-cinnamate dioxygenase ferredoxin subunit
MGEWVAVARADDILPGHAVRVEIDEVPVAIVNVRGELHCVDDTCTHQQASLSEGEVDPEHCAIECPLHGSAFDLRSGDAVTLPAVAPVRVHRVEVADGMVRVALSG